MKFAAVLITTLLFLTYASSVKSNVTNDIKARANSSSGDANVKVNVVNELGTDGNVNSYTSESNTETKTDINISQEGEGTSSVNINGKEWRLEGPGEINVNENTDSSSTPTQTETPTSTTEPTPEVLGDKDEAPTTLAEIMENFFKSLQQFLNNLFRG